MAIGSCPGYPAGMSDRRLNVIILHCDSMRGDCSGFDGNRDARTPRLDAFAADATVLARHFTVHGKCIPSRVAMMTGRYAHSDGIRTVMHENHMPASQPDLMKTLSAHGYETAVFGLNHCWEGFFNDNKPHGVVDWHSYVDGEFRAITDRVVPVPPPGSRPDPDPRDSSGLSWRVTEPLSGFTDDVRTEAALHFLAKVRDRTRPFFLQLNLSAPHPAYHVEEPFYSLHDPWRITPFPSAVPRNATLPIRAQRAHRFPKGQADEAARRNLQATYYGMISKVDLLMGRMLDRIAAEGLFDNSIVIFTSDHGDFTGQYGLYEKYDTVLADCLLRVPFAIRAPGLPRGQRLDALTQHIDLPPTVLEMVGIAPEERWVMHGSSLLPVITGGRRPEAIFADGGHEAAMRRRMDEGTWKSAHGAPSTDRNAIYHTKHVAYGSEPESMARCSMVRTETHKLVARETGEHELYDLRADPFELDNRYGDQSLGGIRTDLMDRLLRWHLRTVNDLPYLPKVGA
jgi:choline-sulfatase